jgi:hypothetical protein
VFQPIFTTAFKQLATKSSTWSILVYVTNIHSLLRLHLGSQQSLYYPQHPIQRRQQVIVHNNSTQTQDTHRFLQLSVISLSPQHWPLEVQEFRSNSRTFRVQRKGSLLLSCTNRCNITNIESRVTRKEAFCICHAHPAVGPKLDKTHPYG